MCVGWGTRKLRYERLSILRYMNNEERLKKAIELLESAIMDFEKLKPWLGDAALATAQLYRDELEKIQCSLN